MPPLRARAQPQSQSSKTTLPHPHSPCPCPRPSPRNPHAAPQPRTARRACSRGPAISPGQGDGEIAHLAEQENTGGGRHGIFVFRLVGGDHFELVNGGRAISGPSNDAQTPDLTFSGNTPYITWVQNINGTNKVVIGHVQCNGTFVRDNTDGAPPGAAIAFRSPLSSGCTANPFTADGSACPGSAAAAPSNLVTQAGTPQQLLGFSLAPTGLTTQPATNITSSGATLNGKVNPGGAPVKVHFEVDFGWVSLIRPGQRIGPANVPTRFSEALPFSAASNTTISFRAIVSTDFFPEWGNELTFKTAP